MDNFSSFKLFMLQIVFMLFPWLPIKVTFYIFGFKLRFKQQNFKCAYGFIKIKLKIKQVRINLEFRGYNFSLSLDRDKLNILRAKENPYV